MEDVLEGLRSSGEGGEDGDLCSCETDCVRSAFSRDRFARLEPKTDDDRNIIFIDGGNAGLLSSPGSCVHFIRIFHTVYRGNRRIGCGADEFYVSCQAQGAGDSVVFSARLFRSDVNSLTDTFFAENFMFDPLDPALRQMGSRLAISKVPGMVRRIAELSTALLLAGRAEKDSIVVIDGDLCAKTGDEGKLLSALRSVSEERKVSVVGLSKTSDLLTSSGRSVAQVLSSMAPQGSWSYCPAAERRGALISFAKLHERSDYVFKIESFTKTMTERVLPLLSANSSDAVFLGYPYGLIEADRFARVSSREKEMLRTMFMVKAGRDWNSFGSGERSLDAHSVLDRIS